MSDASTQYRSPAGVEKALLEAVARRWEGHSTSWVAEVLVCPMDDGGMGSLRLRVRGQHDGAQRFGECVAECKFEDSDGVPVIASLYLDQNGLPFELDVWKTDYSPLLRSDFTGPAA